MQNSESDVRLGNRAMRRAERRAAQQLRRRPGAAIRIAACTALLTAMTYAGPLTANATSFSVTNLDDSGAGSLRAAIVAANGTVGADIITFAPGLTGTIQLTSGQLTISDSLQIVGPGRSALTVDGKAASRVFDIPLSPGDVSVTVSGLTISNGKAEIGGGIRVQDESLTLDDVALTGNAAAAKGGGLYADGFAMTLTVRNSTISGNSANQGGGAYIEDTRGTTTFDGVIIDGNTATQQGGGIFLYDPDADVVINNATITNNAASKGGGIYLYSQDNGTFTISNSNISGNAATTGGGVYLYDIDHAVSISNTTISGNTATNGAGLNIDRISAPAVISNSTISGNIAKGAGGGVRLARGGGLTIAHSTITANSAVDAGGARFPGPVTMTHAIVAGNTAGTTADLHAAGGVTTDFSIIGAMIGAVTDGGGNQFGVTDPLLAPLNNNGGPTRTHLPLANSPAIDTGNPAVAAPATDQRGLPRVSGTIDIGSVEIQGTPATTTTTSTTTTSTTTTTVPPTTTTTVPPTTTTTVPPTTTTTVPPTTTTTVPPTTTTTVPPTTTTTVPPTTTTTVPPTTTTTVPPTTTTTVPPTTTTTMPPTTTTMSPTTTSTTMPPTTTSSSTTIYFNGGSGNGLCCDETVDLAPMAVADEPLSLVKELTLADEPLSLAKELTFPDEPLSLSKEVVFSEIEVPSRTFIEAQPSVPEERERDGQSELAGPSASRTDPALDSSARTSAPHTDRTPTTRAEASRFAIEARTSAPASTNSTKEKSTWWRQFVGMGFAALAGVFVLARRKLQ